MASEEVGIWRLWIERRVLKALAPRRDQCRGLLYPVTNRSVPIYRQVE